jgi:Ca2+-binding EF-hand superfamily protein
MGYADFASASDIEAWQTIFNASDRDRGGSMSTQELGLLLRQLEERANDARIRELVARTDIDQSGATDFDEFVGARPPARAAPPRP